MIKILKRSKAVSPVIATILIIALVVAAGAVVYGLVTNFFDDNSVNLVVIRTNFGDLDSNGMVDQISLVLKNVGSNVIEIDSIEIKANGILLASWVITQDPSPLQTNDENTLIIQTVNAQDQLTTNEENELTIHATNGNRAFIQLEIPDTFSINQIGEAGTVAVGAAEVNVTLSKTYADPVVVVTPIANDSQTVRSGTNAAQWPTITGVGKSWFTVKQSTDSSDTDGVTVSDVNYLVMEVGVHYIRSIQIVVGKATVTGVDTNVTFAKTFTALPIVLASPQTNNMETNDGGARTRFNGLGGDYVTIRLEEGGNSNPGASYVETVGYIAIEAGNEPFSGLQALITADSYNHIWKVVGFDPLFLNPPIVLAHIFGRDGGNAAYAVVTETTTSGFKVAVEEPPSRDGSHTKEKISFMAIPSGSILGTTQTT